MRYTAIITGAARGIGLALAKAYALQGHNVLAADILPFPQEACLASLHPYAIDLNDAHAIQGMFEHARKAFGAVHILINNAAIASFHKDPHLMRLEEFDQVLRVNLRAAWVCAQAFIKANEGERYGRIVNIASTRALQNEAGWEAYGASKGGLLALGTTLAISLSQTPITVNTVSPGWIQCDEYASLRQQDHAQHPSGRVGIPRDIVNACFFLTHPENDFINAHNLVVDGGMSKKMIYEP